MASNAPETRTPDKDFSNPWQVISIEELAKHADVEKGDAWLAVKGIVYDVSAYAAKHPGGADKIEKYSGKDATEVFDMVHSYVQIEEILDGYRVGVLKGDPKAPKRTLCTKLKEGEFCCFGTRYKAPITYFRQDSIVGTYIVMCSRDGSEDEWTVGIKNKRTLHVFKYIDHRKAWLSIYDLPEPLLNDALTIDFKNRNQDLEITLRKPLPSTTWAKQSHGLHEAGRFVSVHQGHSLFDAWIISKKCLTHNIILFGIQLVTSARVGVPVGYHVDLHLGDIVRPYTPVLPNISFAPGVKVSKHHSPMDDKSSCILYFLIKIYARGAFTKALDELALDDGSETGTLKMSTPHGYFPLHFLDEFSVMLLIAGGTGLAPMIRIVQMFTNLKDKMRGKRVALIYFAPMLHDLVWKKAFTEMQENYAWFFYIPVLTKPSEACDWQGLRGRINGDMVKTCLDTVQLDKKGLRKAIVCGPPGFNKASVDSLAGYVLQENIFVFD